MKNKVFPYLSPILGAALIFLVNCGSTSTEHKGEKNRETDFDLAANWQDTCQTLEWNTVKYFQESMSLTVLGDYTRHVEGFSKEGCHDPSYKLDISGTVQSLGSAESASNARDINFSVTSATMTPKSDDFTTVLSGLKYCGISDWQKDRAQDITDLDCLGKSYKRGDVNFDIYQLSNDNKELRFGQQSFWLDGSTGGSRPTGINSGHVFHKQ